MSEKTPLELAKEHWERLLAAVEANHLQTAMNEGWSGSECALCDRYYDPDTETCTDCPVKQSSGYDVCGKTPYRNTIDHLYRWSWNEITHTKAIGPVRAELEFLKSLDDPDT